MVKGAGSGSEKNLCEMLVRRVEQYGSKPALCSRDGKSWKTITYSEFGERVRQTAMGLYALGVRAKDCVCLFSANRPEWTISDYGILSAGAVMVPIYPTLLAKDAAYIINHCEAKVVLVENPQQLEKIREHLGGLKHVMAVVVLSGAYKKLKIKTLSLEEFLEEGIALDKKKPELFETLSKDITREDTATLVYTSGTTGPPKGAMLTHNNILFVCEALTQVWPDVHYERHLSYLPLAHVFERVAGEFYCIYRGGTIYYATALDTIRQDAPDARPNIFIGVPRVYEKFYEGMTTKVKNEKGIKKKLIDWALSTGTQVTKRRMEQKPVPPALQVQYNLADKLVYKKFKAILGGEVEFMVSGAAPLSKDIQEFFHSAGQLLLEGYGLTETTAPATVNLPGKFKLGTVGRAMPGVEIKLAKDGEILIKGGNVFAGYYKNPEATKASLSGGWLYTGDVGELDSEGFLKITDRKKDLIITAGGKNIAPQNIENLMKTSHFISQFVALGDRMPYLVALVTLNKEEIEKFAAAENIKEKDYSKLIQHPQVQKLVEGVIEEKNQELAKFETIKKFRVLEEDFSIDGGELTPTLKVKRKVVLERYGHLVDEMYKQDGKGQ